MTRKKSNVKALALAVTCAILAGGDIGLEPVYAETPIYHDVVKYDSANRTLDYEFDAGAGTGTAAIQKINFGNIVLDGSSGAGTITATSLKLNGIGDVKTAIEGKAAQADVENNKNNIANLQTKTTKISYNATTGTTVEGAITATGNITANGGLSAANGRFTVKASGETVFNDETDLNKTTTIKAGETVVKGANGKVTINNSGINIAQKELGTNKDLSITLDSGYVDASGYVKAPKFIIDNDNGFVKEADGKSRLTVSDVDETGAVTNSVKIGGGNILATGDVNVAGTLCTNTILNATHGEGVTVDGVKFKAGAVSGISDINDGIIKFTKNGTENIVQINSDLMFNDDAGQQAVTLTLEGVKTLNGLSNGSSKIEAGNGSVVGGVTFDEKNITDINDATVNNILKVKTIQSLDGNNEITVEEMATTKYNTDKITYDSTDGTTIAGDVMVNKGAQNQVKITNEGVVVGLGSTVIGSDGVYAGGHNYANAKAAIDGINGKIKGANGAFGVDDNGNVTTTGDIKGKDITASGKLSANGDAVVGGDLSVAGKADFTKEVSFSGGIKTDGIYEATAEKGVTVDGVLLKDKGINAAGGAFTVDGATGNVVSKGTVSAADGKFTVDTDGAVKAAGGKFGVDKDGNTTVGGTLDVTGDTTLKGKLDVTGDTTLKGKLDVTGDTILGGKLDVTGKTTLKDELQVDKKATFGSATGAQTVIEGDQVKTGRIETDATQASKIGGVTLHNGKITADNMTITGTLDMDNLKVNETLEVGTFGVTKAGVVTGVTSINDVAVSKQGTGLKIGSATVGDSNPFSSQGYTVDATGNVSAQDITAGKYNGNEITADKKFNGVELDGGNVKATKVTADTITDGNGFTATGGNVTAKSIQAETGNIAGVSFAAGGNVSGITELTATTIKDGAGTIITGGNVESKTAKIGAIKIENETIEGSSANGLSIEGVKIKDGVMSSVVSIDAAKATIGGVNTLDNTGLTVKTGSKVQVGTNTVIEDGSVKVSQKTSLTDQSLQLNDTNKWTQAGGLVADKATVNGIALGTDSKGKATFSDAAGKTTTIDGDTITTGTITADELNVDKISLGKGTDKNITIGSNGDVTTKGDVTVTGADDDTTVIDGAKATFGKNAANQTIIDKGTIKAKAKSMTSQIAEFGFDENGLTVSGQNAEGKTSYFSYNAKTGVNTFTGQDGTTTAINGSAITSTNGSATGVLNGSNLTLTNGTKSTALEAGKATYTGKAGSSSKHGTTTTIDGGVITTDTLNVERIQLGEKIVDQRTGETIGSGVTLAADGGFTAAGGNFKVTGGTNASKGSITNIVDDTASGNGKTTFETKKTGAGMSYEKGGVKSNVSVGDNNANVSAGAGSIDITDESITSKVTDNATSTITKDSIVDKVGNNSVTTDANGTTFANGGSKTTNINGGTITTGKLITDELIITGKGEAAGTGTGSIAFGGNGTIKSDIKDGDKNTNFTTDIDGVTTKVTDGTTTTENKVSAAGNSNTVTNKDATQKSEFNQGLTSIGGVVTNGEVKIAQTLDGEKGNITNEVTDKDGKSSKLVQSGTGLEYTDSTNADNATRINSSDVSIGSATDDSKRINLSDLGQIDDLDTELSARDEFKNNSTAVGGINAEAAVRREEVARLDNRIDDVNTRVDKVGAMAAAIASLKSIGYDPQAPSEFSIGLGQYKGETGVAMGFFHYPNKNFMINVSLSTAGGETMGGIGATWRFGHKSPQKLLEEQREEQAKKELAAAEKYQAAAKLAKEAQERAEYAAKLARQAQVSADNAKAAADATQAKHFG